MPETANIRALAEQVVYEVRGPKVILDADVAKFYGRTTGAINQQRQRNTDRFTESYAFQLSHQEWSNLKSQKVVSSAHGGRRTRPWAYTEGGFVMLATRVRGMDAVRITQIIVDTFVSYRRGTLPSERLLTSHTANKQRLQLQQSISDLMQTIAAMQLPTGETVASELHSITESAIGRVKAVLDGPIKQNEHISAEIRKLEAETQKVYSDIRKNDAESANLWADVMLKRIQMLRELREMAVQLEREEMMEVMDASFGDSDETNALPRPKNG